jgi:hypothetical protein
MRKGRLDPSRRDSVNSSGGVVGVDHEIHRRVPSSPTHAPCDAPRGSFAATGFLSPNRTSS